MPVRITPKIELDPCRLDFDSIKNICELVEREFVTASSKATDHVWEIYDEPKDSFLSEVRQREWLDSFIIVAADGDMPPAAHEPAKIEVVMGPEQ